MKPKQIFAIVLFILAAVLLGWWVVAGHHPFTTTKEMVPVTDPLFGTVTQTWVDKFTPGLEMIGPIVVVLAGVGLWLLWRNSKQTRTN